MDLFNSQLVRLRRNKHTNSLGISNAVSSSLSERIKDIKGTFHKGLIMGVQDGIDNILSLDKVGNWIVSDNSINRIKAQQKHHNNRNITYLCMQEEQLGLQVNSLDLVVSFLCMHRMNHLEKHLFQIRHILKDRGFFITAFLGGSTLANICEQLINLEVEENNSATTRMAPMIDLANATALVQSAGFHMPIGDKEIIELEFKDFSGLYQHLKSSGETNPLKMQRPMPKNAWLKHKTLGKTPRDKALNATFETLFISGWKN